MTNVSAPVLAIAVLVWPAVAPPWARAQPQRPSGERIEALRARLGQAPELKLTRIRMLRSPTVTADGIQLSGMASAPDSAPGLLPWSQIDQVGTEVSMAGRGAIVGGLVGAAALGILAGVASSQIGISPSYDVEPGAVAAGVFVGGLAGASLGALVTAPWKRWSSIYRGPLTPSNPARTILAKRLSGRPAAVFTSFIIADPIIGDEGITGRVMAATHSADGGVHLAWSEIDRVDVRGGSRAPATLVGAAVGAAIGLGFNSFVHLEPRHADYVLLGCSLAGASVSWLRSAKHGNWSEVYRPDSAQRHRYPAAPDR